MSMDKQPAFPTHMHPDSHAGSGCAGMSLRDWFAAMAPKPEDSVIHMWQQNDRSRNPHNDSHKPKLRSRAEIIAMLAYEHADAMLAARKDTP